MSSIYEKIDNRIETFLSTLRRFPLASFSAFLFTMIMLVLIDYPDHTNSNAIMASKIAFVATLGVVLFPALQLLGRSSIFLLAGLVLLGLYYYFLPQNLHNMGMTIGARHILLSIALFFMILWSPFVGKKSENDIFWQYAQTVIFGLLFAILFAAIVYGGLAAALYAVEKLFHFDVKSIRYAQLALMIFGIFGVNFFLSQIPKHPLHIHVRPYSKIKRIFSKNILAPIAIVYFLILYAYTVKILFSMSYPSGTLSWIIVAFSLVAIMSFLFLSPYLKKSSLSQHLIWFAIFLQTLMLGMALWMRVEEYGMTYNRYLLAMFGVWLVLMSLYFMLFEQAQQKWLFFVATLLIVFSQFGEYSAKNITQKSQTARLIQLISTADPHSEELDMKRKYEISDGINYLYKHYDIDAFESIIPHIFKKYKKLQKLQSKNDIIQIPKYNKMEVSYIYEFPYYATKELGFKFVSKWEWLDYKRNGSKKRKNNYYFYAQNTERSINISDYTHLINYKYSQYKYKDPREKVKEQDDLNLTLFFKENTLFITEKESNSSFSFNLNKYINKLTAKEFSSPNVSIKALTHEMKENNLSIKILFQRINISVDKNITDFSSQILLKH